MLAYSGNVAIPLFDFWHFKQLLLFSTAWLLQSAWTDETLLLLLSLLNGVVISAYSSNIFSCLLTSLQFKQLSAVNLDRSDTSVDSFCVTWCVVFASLGNIIVSSLSVWQYIQFLLFFCSLVTAVNLNEPDTAANVIGISSSAKLADWGSFNVILSNLSQLK